MTSRPADAIVTGFTKAPALMAMSLPPLLELRQSGILRHIHYVTWDSPELDPHLAPLAQYPDIKLTRVPQPKVQGTSNQRGLVYQVRNLEAALDLIPEDDTLVLKSRSDFVADAEFLWDKIENFEIHCATPSNAPLGVPMPKSMFERKIWIPWADCNLPFFFEDCMFLGQKKDVRQLVTPLTDDDMRMTANPDCVFYPHVVRYAKIFCESYPIFATYLRNFHYFIDDLEYRKVLVGRGLTDSFFWHLVIAHAWVLFSHFHVDCGTTGELRFYPNNANQKTDWSDPSTFHLTPPYNRVEGWRLGVKPGRAMDSAFRVYGRLMDDAWQNALFTQEMPDMKPAALRTILEGVANCSDGRLEQIETLFYRKLAAHHHAFSAERNVLAATG
jgi:hypothetical protein